MEYRLTATALCLAVASLTGCGGGDAGGPASYQFDQSNRTGSEYFATEHRVTIDLPEDVVEPRFEAVIRRCVEDKVFNCTLLNSELSRQDLVTATLSARLLPAGVEDMIEFAASGGMVAHRSTAVEDLADPIIDAESRVAMLEQHLADLEGLRERSGEDVDALIRISSEMAEAQSSLEALKGEHEYLKLRVSMDVLNISFGSYQSRSFFSPIGRAFGSFVDDLAEGIAQAITGFAFLLPWIVILVPVALGIRKLFRRRK